MNPGRILGISGISGVGALVRAMWSRVVKKKAALTRLARGQAICDGTDQIKRLAHNRYEVKSQSKEGVVYEVQFSKNGVTCQCPDQQYRKTTCKHIFAVMQKNADIASEVQVDPAQDPPAKRNQSKATKSKATKSKATKSKATKSKATKSKATKSKATKSKAAPDTNDTNEQPADYTSKEDMVERLTSLFPHWNIRDMLDMPPEEAMSAICDAFEKLTPQEATTAVAGHVHTLLLELVHQIAPDEPTHTFHMHPADKEPPACHCGAPCIKFGIRYNKKGPQQTYLCKGPEHHRFTYNPGFERMRYPNHIIDRAQQLYGEIRKLRGTARMTAGLDGKGPHYSTISRWIRSSVKASDEYMGEVGMKGIGQVGTTDEILEDVLEGGSCLATFMDAGTRFCLASHVSETKTGQNSAALFRAAKNMTGRTPMVTIADSLSAINAGHEVAFGNESCAILIRDAHIRNKFGTNNRHERYNSTLREMLERRRGRLTINIVKFMISYYNYLRPHMALGDITPAEKAGMFIHGPKMMTILQNAALSKWQIPHPQWVENRAGAAA